MSDKSFDRVFLDRLALTIDAIERELTGIGERGSPGGPDDEAIYRAYQERGGNPAAAKEQLAAARESCVEAFGHILQFISNQFHYGAIERVDDATLQELTRDGYEAVDNWHQHVAMLDVPAPPENRLRVLLKTHQQLEDAHRAMHDELLWPVARRIFPKN
jgi:hypothetical protein